MFVKASRHDLGVQFIVVDISQVDGEQVMNELLDLGVINNGDLNNQQAWYVIAENLIGSELKDSEKKYIARDMANWLPPLSRQSLLKARQDDIDQLTELLGEDLVAPAIPASLPQNDPLTTVADWLDKDLDNCVK